MSRLEIAINKAEVVKEMMLLLNNLIVEEQFSAIKTLNVQLQGIVADMLNALNGAEVSERKAPVPIVKPIVVKRKVVKPNAET